MAQTVKHLPTMWETRVQSLGREDPLKKEMTNHSSTLAWKIPWMEEHGRLQSMGSQRVRTRRSDFIFTFTKKKGKGIFIKHKICLLCAGQYFTYITSLVPQTSFYIAIIIIIFKLKPLGFQLG